MGVIVAFNYAAWLASYPEFTSPGGSIPVTEAQANNYFALATSMHANDGSGPVTTAGLQSAYLNALTAHFAALLAAPNGGTPSSLVGRISSATEGSVSVTTELSVPPSMSLAFFSQTKYGFIYWQMTAGYRTMQYRVSSNRRGPVPSYGGWV